MYIRRVGYFENMAFTYDDPKNKASNLLNASNFWLLSIDNVFVFVFVFVFVVVFDSGFVVFITNCDALPVSSCMVVCLLSCCASE